DSSRVPGGLQTWITAAGGSTTSKLPIADIANEYQDELKILYDHGLRNVQFDDPNLAYFCSEAMLTGWSKDPLNTYSADTLLEKYITLYNACTAHIPSAPARPQHTDSSKA
ncbi:MAG: hypothetical protein M1823_006840, partial [Watsoniomyces obsoletus]